MSRKSSRADLGDALHTVTDSVAAGGRRARKKARKLAGRPEAPKHRSKKKLAFVLLILGGAGVAARKAMSSKPAPASGNASYPTPAAKSVQTAKTAVSNATDRASQAARTATAKARDIAGKTTDNGAKAADDVADAAHRAAAKAEDKIEEKAEDRTD